MSSVPKELQVDLRKYHYPLVALVDPRDGQFGYVLPASGKRPNPRSDAGQWIARLQAASCKPQETVLFARLSREEHASMKRIISTMWGSRDHHVIQYAVQIRWARDPRHRDRASRVLRLWRDGHSVTQIARRLGHSRVTVYQDLHTAGIDPTASGRGRLTESQICRALVLYLRGYSIRRIARMIRTSRTSVLRWLRRLGAGPF